MTDRSPQDADDGARIRRRGFIGAGLAGAGAALIAPAGAAARPVANAAQACAAASGAPSATGGGGGAGAITHMPLRAAYPHLPAIPLDPAGMLETLGRLATRAEQITQAKQSLTERFTIDGETRTAYEFLFGASSSSPAPSHATRALTDLLHQHPERVRPDLDAKPQRRLRLARPTAADGAAARAPSLEHPEQFSIGWTTLPDVRREGLASLPRWTASLTDADAATRQFWPTIAEHGIGYNLILPEKVTSAKARSLRRAFASIWSRDLRAPAAAGNLYVIDMSRFEALQPQSAHGAPRFTPATITLLIRHPRTGALTPVAILVSGHQGAGRRLFTRVGATDGAWIYALQAAKTSITVFGVWLGHVYHWHLVTAALQMTMFNTLAADHPVHQLLAPQSKYAIGFDDVLLALWGEIAPPTSIATGAEFLQLADDYAADRSYFQDDPKVTLAQLGLRAADFTDNKRWDRYPVVERLLTMWDLAETYVTACVRATYGSDASVTGDAPLQAWIAASAATDGGNIRGLPKMDSRAALISVLTSLVYRVSVHGVSRLNSSSNPALTFVPNFPHCLQRTDIPDPHARLDTRTLLTYLPNTETIGEALNFYYTFVFSTPYEPFIPLGGTGAELFFPGGPGAPRNRALIAFRNGLAAFIEDYQPDAPQRFQWPRNIET